MLRTNYDFKQVIRRYLHLEADQIFDKFIEDFEYVWNKAAAGLSELKEKANMKIKGDLWEDFCVTWLSATYDCKVYKLKELPERLAKKLKISNSRDVGIDLIVRFGPGQYSAVQCKYRIASGRSNRITWKQVSTFYASCNRYEYQNVIVMTNTLGVVKSKGTDRPENHKTIAVGRLRKTPKQVWIKICGYDEVKTLQQDNKPNLEQLRAIRNNYFGAKNELEVENN